MDLIAKNLDKINQMIIDGKNVTPVSSYHFPEVSDNHIVYFSFKNTKNTNANEFFSNIKRLRSISFSDFKEKDGYLPDISYVGIFKNCSNLTSVDFSRLNQRYRS